MSTTATRSPSRWGPRLAAAALAGAGVVVAGYLTAVQAGWLSHAWDPLFGRGSDRVLHSSVAGLLPVPDASLGVLAYAVEVLCALLGGTQRWRTVPWLPLLFELVALGLGLFGLLLVALQALVVQHWCSLCLLSALLSWSILAVGRGEEARAALAEVRSRR